MADDTIDLSAGLKPKTAPKAGGIDLSAGLVAKSTPASPAPDFTSNPHGEGLYEMQGPSGTVHVPFSKVDQAKGQGYSLDEATETRHQRDADASQPSWFERMTEPDVPKPGKVGVAEGLQESLTTGPTNVLKRAARVVAGTLQLPIEAAGIVRRLFSSDEATSRQAESELWQLHPGSQMVDRAKEAVADWRKSPTLATENALGDMLGMYLTGKAAEGIRGVGERLPAESIRKTAQTVVGAGERDVKAHVTDVAEKANTARESTLEANKKADEATLEDRGKIDEANARQAMADDLARKEAEEKTLKAQGVVDESNKKLVAEHAEAVRKAEEETLKARGKVDDANKAARLKVKAEAIGAEKAANANEPYLEGENVETSARQAHDEAVKRQQTVETKRAKLATEEAAARQNVATRVQAVYQAAKDYFKQGFEDVTAKLDAPDEETGEVHTVPFADLDEMADEAEGKIKGSRANVAIFNDIAKKAGGVAEPAEKMFPAKKGEPELAPDEIEALKRMNADGSALPGAKYSDLDGYYQEAGRQIGNPATLPDVRQALVKFRESLGKRMQEMAEDIDPATAKKHALLRRQYKEYAGGFRNYSGPGGSGSPVAMGLQAKDAYNATRSYEGLEPEEARRVEKIITGDSAKPETQFTGKTIIGPDGKEEPAWRFRKRTHAAINDLRNILKGQDALPKPEKLAAEVDKSAAELAKARAKAREVATAKPEQKEYAQPVATPPVPTPKAYPEPEPTPPETPPTEYPQPHETKPVEVPEIDTQRIRNEFITEKLKQWTSVSKFQLARLVAGPIGAVVGAATGHPFLEIGGAIYTAAELTPFALQKLLDRPGVRAWFTKPPAGEIEALRNVPHADRVRIADTFRAIVKEADKNHQSIKLAAPVVAFLRDNGSAQRLKPKAQQTEDGSPAGIQKQIEDMQKQLDELNAVPQ